jgi:hypothetical protein
VTLSFGLEFDPALRRQASGFQLQFYLFALGRPFWGGDAWTGPMNQLPGTSGRIWVSMTWQNGGDALRYAEEPMLYRPSASFVVPAGSGENYEFAVAEEDHYIFGVHRHGFGDNL